MAPSSRVALAAPAASASAFAAPAWALALKSPAVDAGVAAGVGAVATGATASSFGLSTVNQAARKTTAPTSRMRMGGEIWLTSRSSARERPDLELVAPEAGRST